MTTRPEATPRAFFVSHTVLLHLEKTVPDGSFESRGQGDHRDRPFHANEKKLKETVSNGFLEIRGCP